MGIEKFLDILTEIFAPEKAEQKRINKKYAGKSFRPTKSDYGQPLMSNISALYLNANYGNCLEYKCNRSEECKYKRNFSEEIYHIRCDDDWGCTLGKKGCVFEENYSFKSNIGGTSIQC